MYLSRHAHPERELRQWEFLMLVRKHRTWRCGSLDIFRSNKWLTNYAFPSPHTRKPHVSQSQSTGVMVSWLLPSRPIRLFWRWAHTNQELVDLWCAFVGAELVHRPTHISSYILASTLKYAPLLPYYQQLGAISATDLSADMYTSFALQIVSLAHCTELFNWKGKYALLAEAKDPEIRSRLLYTSKGTSTYYRRTSGRSKQNTASMNSSKPPNGRVFTLAVFNHGPDGKIMSEIPLL